MDNLPVLRSAIDALSAEIAHKPNTKFITTFGGDFLAPSLLSSIDQGRSMVAALNALPVDVLCFGNHESDVPFESLLHRIEEFNGVWLNSNMTSISDDLPHPEKCPPHLVVEIAGSGRVVRLAVSKNPKNGDPSAAIVYAAHEATAELVRKLQSPAVELQRSVLARFPPGSLSSVGTRAGPSTMATCLASAMRDAEGCDVAVLHGGSVRGNKVYDSGLVTFGDLQSECPFPSACVVATIDGAALSAAVQRSRTPWSCGNLNAAALHADDGVVIDPITHAIVSVGGAPLSPTRLYTVLIDSYYLASELPDYCAAHPDRIPPDDAGRPALPILSEYFCSRMWMHLVDRDADGKVSCSDVARFVDEADINGDGSIDAAEFEQVVARRLGENFGGKVVAAQCIACADTNKDGVVSSAELAAFLQRQGMAASDGQRRSMARRRSAEAA